MLEILPTVNSGANSVISELEFFYFRKFLTDIVCKLVGILKVYTIYIQVHNTHIPSRVKEYFTLHKLHSLLLIFKTRLAKCKLPW